MARLPSGVGQRLASSATFHPLPRAPPTMFSFLDRYFDRLFSLLETGTLRARERAADRQTAAK